jgi:aspartate carbamoyltransferase regulatory subunit
MSNPIKGYRQLDQDTLDLINKVKLHEKVLLELVREVREHIAAQRDKCRSMEDEHQVRESMRMNAAEPERWASIGRTHFQEGVMALVRALAQPEAL